MRKSTIVALAVLAALAGWHLLAWAACTNTPNLGLCKPAFRDADWLTRLNTNFDILDNPPKLVVSGAGPHAIGGATNAQRQLDLTGSFTPGAGLDNRALSVTTAINSLASADSNLVFITGTLNKASSGTHANFAAITLDPPTIGGGAATVTNASTLRITGAPTGATNNYALSVTAGAIRFPLGGGNQELSVGAVDSGGSGFRLLRVPN